MQPPAFDGAPQVVERAHLELVVEQLDALRPEARQRGHVAELTRHFLFQLIEQLEMSDFDDVGDLTGQVLADSRQFRQVGAGRQHAAHALRQAINGAGRAVISAHAKLVLALDFEQVGGLVEHRRDFGILYRHRS